MPLPIVEHTVAELEAWLNDPLFRNSDPNCKLHKEKCWDDTIRCDGCKEYSKQKLLKQIEEAKKREELNAKNTTTT